MLALNSKITIGDKVFEGVFECHIERSVCSLSATARVRIPARATVRRGGIAVEQVRTFDQIGYMDKVVIELGYNGDYNREFTGYVRNYYTTSGYTEILCEDCFCLTRNSGPVSLHGTHRLHHIVALLGFKTTFSSIEYLTVKVHIDRYYRSEFLSKLKDDNELYIWFDLDEAIHIWKHKGFDRPGDKSIVYQLGYNTISDNLKYVAGEAFDVRKRYEITTRNGKTYEFTVGTGDRVETVTLFDVDSYEQFLEMFMNEARNASTPCYTGDVTTFLYPYAQPGDIVIWRDGDGRESKERSLVEGTVVDFGPKGARRKVTLTTFDKL